MNTSFKSYISFCSTDDFTSIENMWVGSTCHDRHDKSTAFAEQGRLTLDFYVNFKAKDGQIAFYLWNPEEPAVYFDNLKIVRD